MGAEAEDASALWLGKDKCPTASLTRQDDCALGQGPGQ